MDNKMLSEQSGVLGERIIHMLQTHDFNGLPQDDLENRLNVAYLALLQVIISFAQTINLPPEKLIKDLQEMQEMLTLGGEKPHD